MKKSDLLKKELRDAALITRRDKRTLALSVVLQKALLPYKLYPILVGGSAVEYYTRGEYASGDIDYVLPTSDILKEIMAQLGFKKEGRLFIHPELHLVIEFPSSYLEKNETFDEITEGNIKVRIIALEDLIIDRLNTFKCGKVTAEGENILLLLDKLSEGGFRNLKQKAKFHDVLDMLNKLVSLKDKIQKKHLTKIKATDLLKEIIHKNRC